MKPEPTSAAVHVARWLLLAFAPWPFGALVVPILYAASTIPTSARRARARHF